MKSPVTSKSLRRNAPRWTQARSGVTITELLVAATLLVTGMSLLVPVAVRTTQLWRDSQQYQLGIEELQNQMERLTSLDQSQLDQALGGLKASAQIESVLRNPRLTGERREDSDGARLVLSLSWNRPGRGRPLTLVGWLPDSIATPVPESEGGTSP